MSQRRVLITGAASGLGLGLAQRYAKRGDTVACVDLTLERAESAKANLSGGGHLAFAADVGSDDSMQALFDQISAQWDYVDVLINNAGIASGGPMTETTMDEWRKLLEVDLLSVVRGCRLFLPAMLARKSGHILSTASFAGLAGAPGIMTYGVAKAGVVALSEQLRAEVFHKGVRVSVICPSFFRTNLIDTAVGSDHTKKMALRLMDTAPDTMDSVADKIMADADRGKFLIIPTKREPMRWRLKRWFPNLYFKLLLKLAANMMK
jgi:NAD(P)-dependent dehydrogenase (short-subunit alcohol dehydrogenase family)